VLSLQLRSGGSSSQCAPVGPSSARWNDKQNDMPALSPTRWPASAEPMLWGPTLLGTTEPSANSFMAKQRGIEGC
jgi:hypothetical protein